MTITSFISRFLYFTMICWEENICSIIIKSFRTSKYSIISRELLKEVSLNRLCLITRFIIPATHNTCSSIRIVTLFSEVFPNIFTLFSRINISSTNIIKSIIKCTSIFAIKRTIKITKCAFTTNGTHDSSKDIAKFPKSRYNTTKTSGILLEFRLIRHTSCNTINGRIFRTISNWLRISPSICHARL